MQEKYLIKMEKVESQLSLAELVFYVKIEPAVDNYTFTWGINKEITIFSIAVKLFFIGSFCLYSGLITVLQIPNW